MQQHIIVMGISGAGKSTLAAAIAARTGYAFIEADHLHSAANLAKMTSGVALTSGDRGPWLAEVRAEMDRAARTNRTAVVACSALRRNYRDQLAGDAKDVVFVHLVGDHELIRRRMTGRIGHFMPTTLLDDQLATLEPLQPDENGFEVGTDQNTEDVVDQVLDRLGFDARSGAAN